MLGLSVIILFNLIFNAKSNLAESSANCSVKLLVIFMSLLKTNVVVLCTLPRHGIPAVPHHVWMWHHGNLSTGAQCTLPLCTSCMCSMLYRYIFYVDVIILALLGKASETRVPPLSAKKIPLFFRKNRSAMGGGSIPPFRNFSFC